MILTRNYLSIILILALFTILLNFNNGFIYGQQSNAPFVTESELQAALAEVIIPANTYHVFGIPRKTDSRTDPVTSTVVCNPGDIILEGGFLSHQNLGMEFPCLKF